MPAMVENCFSSGVATAEAIVSGLAPGSSARDLDGREVDVGQRRHRQQAIGGDAEDQDAGHDQHRHDRPADEELAEVHDASAAGLADLHLESWARGAAARASRPVSSLARPLATMVRSPSVRCTAMRRTSATISWSTT